MSPRSSTKFRCSSVATRASAARGSPWLPVTSATTLFARQVPVGLLVEKRRQALEHAEFARDIDDPADGAADHDHLAAGRLRGERDRAKPADIRREGGEGDAARRRPHDLRKLARHLGLARAPALAHRVGRVADQREHALRRRSPEAAPRRSARRAPGSGRASSRRCGARCRAACGSRARWTPGWSG